MLTSRCLPRACILRRLAAAAVLAAFLPSLPVLAGETDQASYVRNASGCRIHQARGTVGRARSASSAKPSDSAADRLQRWEAWTFMHGPGSKALRNEGVDGMALKENALRKSRKPASASAGNRKESGKPAAQASRSKDGIRLSIDRQSQEWRQDSQALPDVDEKITMDSHHRVRALAGVKEDDLTIGLGPQFIVKDSSSQVREHIARSNDPDVDAGIGMQFQLDF